MHEYAKAIVALVMAVLGILATVFGPEHFSTLTEEVVTAIILALIPLFVYLVPNGARTR